jgi:retron-type reverse transcriptase
MKKFYLPKSTRKKRVIYSFTDEQQNKAFRHMFYLNERFKSLERNKYAYGFIPGRNCVENAAVHCKANFIISLDIANFFDSIKLDHLNFICKKVIDDCSYNKKIPQGLCTSPIISNIFFISIDEKINDYLKNTGIDYTYSRYADDLTIGFFKKVDFKNYIKSVEDILIQYDLKLNKYKTKIQNIKNGRFIITGVGVDKDGVYPSRKTLRKIRAAKDQSNYSSLSGLLEWSQCKFPKRRSTNE